MAESFDRASSLLHLASVATESRSKIELLTRGKRDRDEIEKGRWRTRLGVIFQFNETEEDEIRRRT